MGEALVPEDSRRGINVVDLQLGQADVGGGPTRLENKKLDEAGRDRGGVEVGGRAIVLELAQSESLARVEKDRSRGDLILEVRAIEQDQLVEGDGLLPGERDPCASLLAVGDPLRKGKAK